MNKAAKKIKAVPKNKMKKPSPGGKGPKILIWDIEATNLAADYGRCLCIGYKFLGGKTKLLRIRDFPTFAKDCTDDKDLLKAFTSIFSAADLHVTWFGDGFDYPFLQTRLMMQGLDPLPNIPSCDGWRIARKRLKFRSNRLDGVSKAIPYSSEIDRLRKTPITPEQWVRGSAGHIPSLKYIEEHCIADVDVLEQVYLKLRPYAFDSANLSKLRNPEVEGCAKCGSKKISYWGYRLTARGKSRRFQCQDCGGWGLVPVRAAAKDEKARG